MPSETTSSRHSVYLCIKDMKVNRANAMPSPYIGGLPSMYGVVGMAKHLVDRVLKGSGMAFEAVAISINQFMMSESQHKYSAQTLRDIKKKQGVRVITGRDCWFKASVFIRVNIGGRGVSVVREWLDAHRHLDGLYRLRFCGGHIIYGSGSPELHLLSETELPLVCRHIDGFLIVDRIDLCRAFRQPDEDALDTMLLLIQESKNMGHGWLVPLAVGFIPFGDRQYRANTRQKLLHGFCEPVTGLGRLFNVRSSASSLGKSDHFFWKPNVNREFLVTGSI